jgi:hypothetical protein
MTRAEPEMSSYLKDVTRHLALKNPPLGSGGISIAVLSAAAGSG